MLLRTSFVPCLRLDWAGSGECLVLFCLWEEVRQEFRWTEIIQNSQSRAHSRTWPHGAWNHSLANPGDLGRPLTCLSSSALSSPNSTALSICSSCTACRVSFCSHSLPFILTLTTNLSVFKTELLLLPNWFAQGLLSTLGILSVFLSASALPANFLIVSRLFKPNA